MAVTRCRTHDRAYVFAVTLAVLWPLFAATAFGLSSYLRRTGLPIPGRLPTMAALLGLIFIFNAALVGTVLRERAQSDAS